MPMASARPLTAPAARPAASSRAQPSTGSPSSRAISMKRSGAAQALNRITSGSVTAIAMLGNLEVPAAERHGQRVGQAEPRRIHGHTGHRAREQHRARASQSLVRDRRRRCRLISATFKARAAEIGWQALFV